MPTQGSWRPKVSTMVAWPCRSIERRGVRMELVGLMAMATRMSCPLLMPPSMPPALLDKKPSGVSSSPCTEPRCATLSKPAPISTPLTALRPIMACAMSASSLSNSGSPQPTGTPVASTTMRAPTESPALRSASMAASSCAIWLALGAKKGFWCTCSQPSKAMSMSPSALMPPRKPMPCCSASHLRATAPAPTMGAVRRAELRPPPRGSRRPYLWK